MRRIYHFSILAFAALTLAACASTGTLKQVCNKCSKNISAAATTPATVRSYYCRTRPDHEPSLIIPSNPQEFEKVGSTGINFEIQESYNGYEKSDVDISEGDVFTFDTVGTGTLNMTHSGKDTYKTLVAHLASDLWMEGNYRVGNTLIGTYFVYRTPPGPNDCRHSDPLQDAPCHGIHVEFFDIEDKENRIHRPVFGKNVFPYSLEKCGGVMPESSEGDGDEGKR
jgi:hypothetical protein